MFLEGKDYLSIWEIAHRWAGFDPEATAPTNLPEPVVYHIHKLIEGYLSQDLILRRGNGYLVPSEDWLLNLLHLNVWQNYLWKCLNHDKFNKKKLNNYFVRRSELLKMCEKELLDPPAFWIKQRPETSAIKPTISNRPKDEETDRLLCQAIARAYWGIDPQIHPAHMTKAKVITQFGNGKFYKDPDTIKKWIMEVDPLKDQRKTGRPVEIPYLIDLETGGLRQN